MKRHELRHARILELRSMALRGATIQELQNRCRQMKVSKPTERSYIKEVVQSIQLVMRKAQKQ